MNTLRFAPLVLAVAVIGLAGVALTYGGMRAADRSGALIGKPAPAMVLAALPSRSAAPDAAEILRGPAFVNFVASWCGPCKLEHPLVTELARQSQLPVYAVAYKDSPEDLEAYLAENGDPYAGVALDVRGQTAVAWGVRGVPETFLIDAQGRVRAHHPGPLADEDLARYLALAEAIRAGR